MKFTRSNGPLLSVLLPTRGRYEQALESLYSIAHTSSRAMDCMRDIEVLVRIDDDDPQAALWRLNQSRRSNVKVVQGPRFGYSGHHHYYNEVAKVATGDWLLLWNDDAKFADISAGWDLALLTMDIPPGCSDEVCMLLGSMGKRSYGDFPLTRRAASVKLGHYAQSPQVDSYLLSLYWKLGAIGRIPIDCSHELQGDATSREVQEALPLARKAQEDSGPVAAVDRAFLRGMLVQAGVAVGPDRY